MAGTAAGPGRNGDAMIIGLDVGGTHTDAVLLESTGLVKAVKVPTDAADLFHTVETGLEEISAGITPREVRRVVLSTTLTTNAVVQGKVGKVGMIVSAGPGIDPEFFRTGAHYFCVSGSIDHRGREREALDTHQIRDIAGRLKAADVRHVGVVGKFSVRNPAHELAIEETLGEGFEKVFLGHRIAGGLNFPRRIATTYLNAAVYPLHKNFFEAVRKSLRERGLDVPIYLMKADGGTLNFASAMDFPGQTILSGPAASVAGAIAAAPAGEQCLVLDIGGTTTDMAVLVDRAPLLNPVGVQLGCYKTLIRALDARCIGVGGDSAVRVVGGRLDVSSQRQGPAMAFGGPAPTTTDALCVLGEMESGDLSRARRGIASLADKVGKSCRAAAGEVFDLACRRILAAANDMVDQINSKPVYTIHELKEGLQIQPRKMLLMGAPAAVFARRLQALSDFECAVVPRWEVANAIGSALARTTCAVTLFADTEQGIAMAPEENFQRKVGRDYSSRDALTEATALLKRKALAKGARPEDLEVEVVEEAAFNMVRGFATTGQNIRVKVQVKPGLIHEYAAICAQLARPQDGSTCSWIASSGNPR